ncbi:SpoIIE family protein phosphatase [Streptomyces sp. NPDC058424]|uniref:ATP-binding SpoIIE family protein phosphatase n=1 Tax=Streptomyces sp. NPDC058424 TaxID=3346491 RepID=UPI003657A597
MNGFDPAGALALGAVAAAVVDEAGTVVRWSRAAADLLGHPAEHVCGRPVGELLADASDEPHRCALAADGFPAAGRTRLRHRSGRAVEVAFRIVRLEGSSELLALAAPAADTTEREQGLSLLRALFAQARMGVTLRDTDLALVRTNITLETLGGPPGAAGVEMRDVANARNAEAAEAALRRVLETGTPLIGEAQDVRSPLLPGRHRTLSLSAFRLEDAQGESAGVVTLVTDISEQQRTRDHLDLLRDASTRIGGSLDVARTAQDLVDVLVPALGDLAWVELADPVIEGDEPANVLGGAWLSWRRVAVASADGTWPSRLLQKGAAAPRQPDIPTLFAVQRGDVVVVDSETISAMFGEPHLIALLVPENARWLAVAPLFARGTVLGVVGISRSEQREPFDEDEADLLKKIASRAALSVDNARRYTREHRAAVALQRRLLPRATTETPAAETIGVYRPAGGGAEISGDWFDVLSLPSLRAAFVVGDVIGHGLHATATMGRLRTAVQTLADLELDCDELLTHLDDLVQRLAGEAAPENRDTVGATCLYALYDPVARRCALASAGHPVPVVSPCDGTARPVDLSPGPPLGVGGMPFETATLDLAPGSVLALYTDGLIKGGDGDTDAGLRRLTDRLAAHCRPGRPLDEIGRALLAGLDDHPPRDDIALLLVRTRAVPAESVAHWEFPADPASVSDARDATTRQLAAWGLDDIAFSTELVVSELVTNAVRYAGGPIGLRLIHEDVLVCEVSDPSNTQPRLRRAQTTDEGGRGLFLVAQLSTRWGSRYSQRGKTIWAEQAVGPCADQLMFSSVIPM